MNKEVGILRLRHVPSGTWLRSGQVRNQVKPKTMMHNSLFIIPLRKGFALIELLVAVAMVGILVSVTVSVLNPSEQFKKGRDVERKQDLRQLQTALESYNTDNNRYPAATDNKISGAAWGDPWSPHMAKVPKDPLNTGKYVYYYESDGVSYRLYANLERCPESQTIPQTKADCATAPYNYSATSSNLAVALTLPTLSPPTPTPTLTPKKVFVTSTTSNGDLVTFVKTTIPGESAFTGSGLDAGDRICKWRADTVPALSGKTWKAWLSDSTPTHAKDRITWTGEYRLVDGDTIVANNKTDLTTDDGDGNWIKNPIKKNEINAALSSEFYVWTGTGSSGTFINPSFTPTCGNWMTTSGTFGQVGLADLKTSGWTNAGGGTCSLVLARLYCFEQ